MVGTRGTASGTIVEDRIVRQQLRQRQHVAETGDNALFHMCLLRYGQVAGENGKRIHQDVIMPLEGNAFLHRRTVCRTEEATTLFDGTGIYLGSRRDDPRRIELYLI